MTFFKPILAKVSLVRTNYNIRESQKIDTIDGINLSGHSLPATSIRHSCFHLRTSRNVSNQLPTYSWTLFSWKLPCFRVAVLISSNSSCLASTSQQYKMWNGATQRSPKLSSFLQCTENRVLKILKRYENCFLFFQGQKLDNWNNW